MLAELPDSECLGKQHEVSVKWNRNINEMATVKRRDWFPISFIYVLLSSYIAV